MEELKEWNYKVGIKLNTELRNCIGLISLRMLIPWWETRNEEFENKEFLARKTDEKNEKMRDQKSSILEAFGEEMIENSK